CTANHLHRTHTPMYKLDHLRGGKAARVSYWCKPKGGRYSWHSLAQMRARVTSSIRFTPRGGTVSLAELDNEKTGSELMLENVALINKRSVSGSGTNRGARLTFLP